MTVLTPNPASLPALSKRQPLTRRQWCRQQAHRLVWRYTALATASTCVPAPGLNLGVELLLQIRMARQLCGLYGATFSVAAAGEVASGLLGGTSLKARSVAAMRYVSFATYWTGGVPSLATTAGFTWLLGELLIERLEAHGSIAYPAPSEPLTMPAPTPIIS